MDIKVTAAPSRQQSRIGVDTGGTFTDFVWFENGQLKVHKELSTALDPSRAVIAGLSQIRLAADTPLVHGSTVATNALLQRRGARTALLTTAGFRDVLALGRQERPELYALVPSKPPELIPRRLRLEVDERISADGETLQPLQADSLKGIVDFLEAEQIESVAVCLLFSFLRPAHEQAIRDYFSVHGSEAWRTALHISLSSEILPEFREYERTSTTVINAFVAPIMARYLKKLEEKVRPRPVVVMQSNGGIISAGVAGSQAARTVLSGPAGGVVGAFHVARQCGFEQIITFDMGGTSSDVALCPGVLPATSQGEIAGMPLRLPVLDIHTVGAGGGSLVALDAGGALHVGPQSAGADPGPISYGRAARAASEAASDVAPAAAELYVTTTDANLVLGRLDADYFLGGAMRLDVAAAERALAALAQQIGAPAPQAAAWDVIRVANATMERAIRKISVERGYDPRTFTLVAFGGAGPLHACDLAQNLRIPRVLIPPAPGALSALGMLVAEPMRDYSQTVLRSLQPGDDESWLQSVLADLQQKASRDMVAEGYDEALLDTRRSVDLRYLGQAHELNVPYDLGQPGAVLGRFHEAHERRYGFRREAEQVEVVTIRLTVVAPTSPPSLARLAGAAAEWPIEPADHKTVWFEGRPYRTGVFHRDALGAGAHFFGPAVVFQYDSTTVTPPGWRAEVHETGSLILHWERPAQEEQTPPV